MNFYFIFFIFLKFWFEVCGFGWCFCVIFGVLSGCGEWAVVILCRFWHILCPSRAILGLGGIFPCLVVRKWLKTAVLRSI